jgi:hypothetical protein
MLHPNRATGEPYVAAFDGGTITSDAGTLLLGATIVGQLGASSENIAVYGAPAAGVQDSQTEMTGGVL